MKIDEALLTSKLLVEPANGQYFPHIYGSINRPAIVGIEPVKL